MARRPIVTMSTIFTFFEESFKMFQAWKQDDDGEISNNINSWLHSYWRILNPFSMLNSISTIEFL